MDWYCKKYPYYHPIAFFFFFLFPWPTGTIALIRTCGKRKAGIRCRGDGYSAKVPRVDPNHISYSVFSQGFSHYRFYSWTFLFFFPFFIDFFLPRKVPGSRIPWTFGQLDLYTSYVLPALLHVTTLDFAMWSRSIPLQESRHRMLSSLQSRVVLLETNWSSMVSLKIICLVSGRLSNVPPSTHL